MMHLLPQLTDHEYCLVLSALLRSGHDDSTYYTDQGDHLALYDKLRRNSKDVNNPDSKNPTISSLADLV